ncbi:MAG TPA: carboxypeptidase-like regulatory domain-containing protein [Candidatus Limnocylindrales bacterium]|nr:carboxypeptidase-like regulatory domain-containing protein [Candidatus Limnocylindrales bacterium]
MKNSVLTTLGVFALSMLAFGQASDGNLVGAVTDVSGAAVPNVNVVVKNHATGLESTAKTTEAGEYRFNNLPVGIYDLTATATGFATARLGNLSIDLNKTSTANLSLQLGAVSSTVDVSEAAATLDTTTAQVGATFTSAAAIDIPASSLPLGVLNLSLLEAGVSNPGGIGLGDGPSVGGQRPRNNSFSIEGVNDDRRDVTGHNLAVPNEAVAEFSMLQNQFSAEFGDSTGGQFNTVVKSGGNRIHGSAFEYLQNRNLNANDNLNALSGILSPPRYDSNTFGGSVGGPIKKDKLFYYGLYQYNPTGQAPASAQGAIYSPTAAGYSQLASIPGVSSTNLNVLKTYLPAAPSASKSTPVCPGLSGASCTSSTPGAFNIPIGVYPVTLPSYLNITDFLVSIDYNLSASDQIRGRYLDDRRSGFDTSTLPALPSFFQQRQTTSKLVAFSEFHTFAPSVVNEFRLGYQRYNDSVPSGDYSFPGLDAFPNIVIANDLNVQLGPYSTSPQFTIINTYQAIDNLSWTKGKHTIKVGWEGRKYIDGTVAVQRVRGDYDYKTLGQFILDYTPDQLAERNVGVAPYSGNAINTSLFANDSYRWKPNVTINIGLRWQYDGVPHDDKQWTLNSIASVPGLIEFRAPTAQLNAFAPRLGIAYSPGSSGRTSIRAGFGMAYDKLFENLGTNNRPPEISTTVDAPSLGGATPGYLATGGIPARASAGPACTDALSCRAITSGYVYDEQLPYAITWNAGIQHVFHQDYTFEARYLGTKGVHLFTQNRINRIDKVTASRFIPTYLQTPSAATLSAEPLLLGDIQAFSSFDPAYLAAGFTSNIVAFPSRGNSEYHGLALELTRRFTNSLLLKAAYTWSHNIDDSTADLFSTLLAPRRPQDFQNMSAEKSASFLDRRQRLTLTWLYELPAFRKSDNKFFRFALGGYMLSGTYTYESPQFATVQSGIDSNLNGDSAGDRAIVNPQGDANAGSDVIALARDGSVVSASTACKIGGQATTGTNCTAAYVASNPNARYIIAGAGALANAGRNTIPLRPINNFDVQVKKEFLFKENVKFQIAAQAFNLFNHPQYVSGYINNVQFHDSNTTNLNLVPNSSVFGQPDQVFSSNPRGMQLTARFEF